MAQNPQLLKAASLSGPAKLTAVTRLVAKLTEDLEKVNLFTPERDALLEELKIYGRDPRDAGPIFTKEGITMLAKHALLSPYPKTWRHALRVLCNALLLEESTRQMFVDLHFEQALCNKLKNDDRDDEFLASRLLFLTTYGTNADLEQLVDKHKLASLIAKNLERHAKRHHPDKPPTDPMVDMALTETLKLMFNITHYCKDKISLFTPTIPFIVNMLCQACFRTEKPLDPPVTSLVNALYNLDLGDKAIQSFLFPSLESVRLSDCLIGLLDRSRVVYKDGDAEGSVTPLLGVIRAVHEHGPSGTKRSIRKKLLPTEDDRRKALGRTDSLPSWLLKNSTNPTSPELRETISDLLFDMSDKDSSTFVDNIGYGFASGFLFSRNIPIPQNASEASSSAAGNRPVNPVTGQFLDAESQPAGPEMSQAEREREAERLFVLFERLRANGVISAENPVRTAQEEGRFEELPDDYEEDKD
ncbi:guanine nucleotide exchange factor [Xylariaceae sp. FL0804]|nr:guanine nucleotide exchange factor [Xylariaceae sp. FL0804]